MPVFWVRISIAVCENGEESGFLATMGKEKGGFLAPKSIANRIKGEPRHMPEQSRLAAQARDGC